MLIQHMLHTAVEDSDFELRSLPLFFYYIMQNYARCGSFYTELLSSLEANYPGLKDPLSKIVLSVQV